MNLHHRCSIPSKWLEKHCMIQTSILVKDHWILPCNTKRSSFLYSLNSLVHNDRPSLATTTTFTCYLNGHWMNEQINIGCGHLKSVLLQPEQYQVHPHLSLSLLHLFESGGESEPLSLLNRPGVRSLSGFWSHSMTICGITSTDLSWAMLSTTTHFMATIGRLAFQLFNQVLTSYNYINCSEKAMVVIGTDSTTLAPTDSVHTFVFYICMSTTVSLTSSVYLHLVLKHFHLSSVPKWPQW